MRQGFLCPDMRLFRRCLTDRVWILPVQIVPEEDLPVLVEMIVDPYMLGVGHDIASKVLLAQLPVHRFPQLSIEGDIPLAFPAPAAGMVVEV